MIEQIEKVYISAEFRMVEQEDYEKENTDVIVLLQNGNKYSASFFTYDNIKEQSIKNSITGDYLGGKYFWEKDMLIVEDCSEATIKSVIKNLIEEGDFFFVFSKL